jgi:hypothetical protein
MSKKIEKLAKEAIEVMAQLEAAKPLYQRLDELTLALVEAKSKELRAYGLVVVDNFAEKNAVFRPACVRRFEVKKVG